MKKLWGIYCFVVWGITTTLQAAWFSPKTFTLNNGLQVVVLHNPKAPAVSHNLWVKAGGMDDPIGKSGVAHFLEHLFLRSAGGVPMDEFNKILDRMGAQHNAATSWDYTHYYQEMPVIYLEKVMMMMAARLRKLELTPEMVNSERKVILEERFMRIENEPKALLQEAISKTLFWHHPYGMSLIGWKHEMETLSQKDVESFHHAYYCPSNCVLILAGDITLERAQELAERYYGSIPRRNSVRQHLKEPPHHNIASRHTLRHKRVGIPQIARYFRLPRSIGLKEMRTQVIYDLLGYIISNQPLGAIHQEFVVKRKLAVNVAFWIYYPSVAQTVCILYAIPQEKIKPVTLVKQIHKFLKNYKITEEKLTEAKHRLLIADQMKKDHIFAGAHVFGEHIVSEFSVEDIEQTPALLQDITVNEVQNVLQKIVTQKDFVDGLLLPSKNSKTQNNETTTAIGLPMTTLGH